MQINVSQLLQEPIGSTRYYDIDADAELLDDGNKYGVKGECGLMRTRRGILVRCTLLSEVELACGRCLRRFRQPLKIKFEEEFLPTIDVTSGIPLARTEDTVGAFMIDEHHTLDLTEAARQYILMSVPMKPLCAPECAGLCPKCGRNLNEGKCACPAETINPRWEALTKLTRRN